MGPGSGCGGGHRTTSVNQFLINFEKSRIGSCHWLDFLGMIIDARSLSFIFSEEKKGKDALVGRQALEREKIRLRDLGRIIGRFAWAIPAVPFAQSHYRRVQSELIRPLYENKGNF